VSRLVRLNQPCGQTDLLAARARWRLWLPVPSYLLLTVVMTWPLVTQLTSAIPGDSFDGWQNFWNLWWLRVALVERVQDPFVTDLLYAPTGVTLHFHTLNPFNGLLTLPLQLAAGSGGLFVAYNAVVFFSFAMSGYGAFLLTRWTLRSRAGESRFLYHEYARYHEDVRWWASLVAGAVFAFAPFHMAHLLGHMQVFAYQWVPFASLALLMTMERAARADGVERKVLQSAWLAGLFFALMALCDWYFALYLLLFGLGAWVWRTGQLLLRGSRAAAGRVFLACLLAGGVALLLLGPVLVPMVREAMQDDYMVRPAEDLYLYSASVADFLIPNRLHTLFRPGSFAWPGNQVAPVSERTLAVGYIALGLALTGVFLDRRRSGAWIAAALLFGLLALGPRPHWGNIVAESIPPDVPLDEVSPYNILNRLVPFMRISRSVSRFALMVQLSMAVAAGVGLWAVMRRLAEGRAAPSRQRARGAVAALVALLLLLAEYWVAPYPVSPPDTPLWYTTAEAKAIDPARPALLNLPMNYDRPGYLLYQTEHKRPLTVAYISRDDPRTLTERVPLLQHLRHLGPDIIEADPGVVGATVLQDLGVGTVVLDRYKMPGGLERTYTEEVARSIFGLQAPQFEDERITVYSAPHVDSPVAYLRLGATGWGPLEQDAGEEMRGRRIDQAGASVEVAHARGGERLVVDYRSDAPVIARTLAGALIATFPAAPNGGSETLGLPADGVVVLAASEGDVLVVGLALK